MSALRDAKSRERMIAMNTTHGLSNDPAYPHWKDMKKRCFNPANKRFRDYAERGISVHQDFVDSFPKFLEEIGPKPEGDGWSVGRIDNNDWYTYENIRWERIEQQARNHTLQRNNTTGIAGIKYRRRKIGPNYYSTYTASVSVPDHKRLTKEFSADKYGDEQAKAMAVAWRAEKLKELESAGIEYAASHGSPK